MRAHVLQHVPFEGPGSIELWLRAAGHACRRTRMWADELLPHPTAVDLLLVMGGPMSANDEQSLPWLTREKRFIGAVMSAGTPVLGICLGAQLLAAVLGARVAPAETPEIGWLPVQGVAGETTVTAAAGAKVGGTDSASHDGDSLAGGADTLIFPRQFTALHWHGETFELPAGAQLLATSAGCRNQAFRLGPAVLALQFHLEVTPEGARALVGNCAHELAPAHWEQRGRSARYIQSAAEIEAAAPGTYRDANRLMDAVMQALTGIALPPAAPAQ